MSDAMRTARAAIYVSDVQEKISCFSFECCFRIFSESRFFLQITLVFRCIIGYRKVLDFDIMISNGTTTRILRRQHACVQAGGAKCRDAGIQAGGYTRIGSKR